MFEKRRILGMDPGLARRGTGVVDSAVGRPPVFVTVGVVRTNPNPDVVHRLLQVEAGLERQFTGHTPNVIAVEHMFARHNTTSMIDAAQAAEIAALTATRHGLPVTFHTPSEIKIAVTDSGRAGKPQVISMVTTILRLDVPPRPTDAADILALAVCHAWRGGHASRYAALAAAAREKR